jgi:hypothetical protein
MVNLTDPQEAVRQILFENWNLHGNLGRDEIDFNTGAIAPSRKYPSIEVLGFKAHNQVLTIEWWMNLPLLHIHVWERPKTTERNAIATSQNKINRMVNQIYDILTAQQLAIEDFQWAFPEEEINQDQFHAVDMDTTEKDSSSAPTSRGEWYPILHRIIPVRGLRWRHKVLGGIAFNR